MRTKILLTLVSIFFISGQFALSIFFPLRNSDPEIWDNYFIAKDGTYDIMFFMMFLVCFWSTNGFAKAVCAVMIFMAGGSVIDKVVFGINQYLLSDILLTAVALLYGWRTYKNEKVNGRL